MKEAHEKCTFCGPIHKNVYYQDYQDLAKHFEKSHFACTNPDCKAQGFVAFKHKHQLDDHLYKVHGHDGGNRVIITSKDDDEGNNKLNDTYGINMTRQVIFPIRKFFV